MNIIRKTVVAAVAALALAGCTTDTPAVAPSENTPSVPEDAQTLTLDEIFIKVVHQEIPQVKSVPDSTLIDAGHDVCDTFERVGVSPETFRAGAEGFVDGGNGLFSPRDAGAFFGASTATYCPNVNEELERVLGLDSSGGA